MPGQVAGPDARSTAGRGTANPVALPRNVAAMSKLITDGNMTQGSRMDVMGCVTKVRLPIRCASGAYKMTVYMTDLSLQNTTDTMAFHIFLPDEDSMPKFQLADVLLVKSVLVQPPRGGDFGCSLVNRPTTRIHIYRAPSSSPSRLEYVPTPGAQWGLPSAEEAAYALHLHRAVNKDTLPDITTFDESAARSMTINDKRRALQDVGEGKFCDLLVQVVSEPRIASLPCALFWVSDYTENPGFECKGSPVADGGEHGAGDANGYLTKFGGQGHGGSDGSAEAKWSGPDGQRSMHIVCYAPHWEYIQQNVRRNSWITMKNVLIQRGKTGVLEGALRDDPQRGSPLRVDLLDTQDIDRNTVDPRFLEALRRKKAYETRRKADKKKRKEPHDGTAAEGKPLNAKQRRALLRQEKSWQAADVTPLVNRPNDAIVSDFGDRAVTPLACILAPGLYTCPGAGPAGADLLLPFANIQCKAQVRVVDFLPHRLVDFAASRPVSEYAALGSDDSSCSSSSDDGDDTDDDGSRHRVWEWSFALLLEDASGASAVRSESSAPRPRIWAVVNNFDGQALLNCDASDLRKDRTALRRVRQKLFLLWGNLEETKLAAERRVRADSEAAAAAEEAGRAAEQERIRKERARQTARDKMEREREQMAARKTGLSNYPGPPIGDSDDESAPPSQSAPAEQQKQKPAEVEPLPKLANRPFVCCLRQYGVRVSAADNDGNSDDGEEQGADEDGEGEGEGGQPKKTWQRMFGMFGTRIRD